MAQKSIFISYRREDSAGHAGRIKDRLEREFGDTCRLFMDVDAIPLGVDFARHLTAEVATCDVLLAMIGRQWIDIRDDAGERRLDQPHDYVRIEIGAALQRDIPVIPLLFAGARMPRTEVLPDNLKALSGRNSLDIHDTSFQSDVDRLVRELRRRFFPEEAKPAPPVPEPVDAGWERRLWWRALISTMCLAIGAAAGFFGGLVLLSFLATVPLKYLSPGRSTGELTLFAALIGFLATIFAVAALIRSVRRLSTFSKTGLTGLFSGIVVISFVALSESHMTSLGPVVIAIAASAPLAVLLFVLLALLKGQSSA